MKKKTNLKTTLCNELIEKGIVKEGQVIRHSYTNNRLNNGVENMGRVESQDESLSPTLDTRCDTLGIVVNEENTKRYKNYITWRNNKGEFNTECNRASLEDDLALTIPTKDQTKVALSGGGSKLRIRKLTPKECIRLMGFTNEDYEAMRKIGMTDSAIYHMAGDSIVVSVLIGIFSNLMYEDDRHKKVIKEYIEKEIIEGK